MIGGGCAKRSYQTRVLLALENHSFDQMLGGLKQLYPELEGVTRRTDCPRRAVPLEKVKPKDSARLHLAPVIP